MHTIGESYYIGIDVGTGSVRAAVVSKSGKIVATSTQEIKTWRDPLDHRVFEQSTTDIWAGVGKVIKECLHSSGVDASAVKGLGFDATCSLAVTDFDGAPVEVTRGEHLGRHGERNIILWADHRAEEEAELINATGSIMLDYVGGTMSVRLKFTLHKDFGPHKSFLFYCNKSEKEIPKILWLKHNMGPALFRKCKFFDLPDFLAYQATKDDSLQRSFPERPLMCKCAYVPKSGWLKDFFKEIGLQELTERDYAQVGVREGDDVLIVGMPVGKGLSQRAAEELGLVPGTPVGSALVDAYVSLSLSSKLPLPLLMLLAIFF